MTDELDEALKDADAVLIQIRVGGQAARLSDETVPLALRLHRPGDDRRRRVRQGDEDGAGGAGDRGAGESELAAPEAWIVDFTNPVGIVTRALLDAGHRAVGLCNVAIGFQREFAQLLDVPRRTGSRSTRSASTT